MNYYEIVSTRWLKHTPYVGSLTYDIEIKNDEAYVYAPNESAPFAVVSGIGELNGTQINVKVRPVCRLHRYNEIKREELVSKGFKFFKRG